ncbi:DUF397 domain-containing protein [Streptomyces sp. ME02-8801-2C]|uniref:DUF397 domain-containing protein n=1 Tax=Streptomyces sp. ME02-8801-2C TaxID=3028680 RepID=UPI0029BE0FB4|nr:DUF397 domain-containing protein [Streptomyces sp. ME02-8801-2C]MDX3455663.1 DUF397 domain-containing protein [Streptomyces sp. ME02-8801-2C]
MASGKRDLSTPQWRKSSYSNGSGGDCVEVGLPHPEATELVPVRDSKTAPHNGPVLLFQAGAWSAFLGDVKVVR